MCLLLSFSHLVACSERWQHLRALGCDRDLEQLGSYLGYTKDVGLQ